jgi:putative restriction endonuclease
MSAKKNNRPWTRAETLAAFNLYCTLSFAQFQKDNKDILRWVKILKRSPSSICMKLWNLSRLDPKQVKRGAKGLPHGAKLEAQVWDEFHISPEELVFESEQAVASFEKRPLEEALAEFERLPLMDLEIPEGREKTRLIRTRVNQSFFRRAVLAAYDRKCCITGLAMPDLLNASHIVPWRDNPAERLNPRNGLCLNALHDRAFDRGLISVKPNLTVAISPRLRTVARKSEKCAFIAESEGAPIASAQKFPPDKAFLKYHYQRIFRE